MKVRSLLVVVLLIAVVASPGAPAAAATASAAAKPLRIAVVMPSATTDMAFSQSMFSALKAIQTEMGGESAMEIKYSENMFKVPDAAAAIRDYASQGFDIVIAHGSQYGTSVQEVAKDFPKVTFAWGTDVNTFGMANVYAYTAAAEEGGYVNGVMAAMLTKSKVIGVTGPVEVGDAKTYIDGFIQGVASVDPEHQGLQDLDRLLLGRGADDRSGQDPHRRRRGRADRLVAVGGRLHRRGQGEGQRAVVRHAAGSGLAGPADWSSPARCTTGPACSRR